MPDEKIESATDATAPSAAEAALNVRAASFARVAPVPPDPGIVPEDDGDAPEPPPALGTTVAPAPAPEDPPTVIDSVTSPASLEQLDADNALDASEEDDGEFPSKAPEASVSEAERWTPRSVSEELARQMADVARAAGLLDAKVAVDGVLIEVVHGQVTHASEVWVSGAEMRGGAFPVGAVLRVSADEAALLVSQGVAKRL